jgi:hypothetical protein
MMGSVPLLLFVCSWVGINRYVWEGLKELQRMLVGTERRTFIHGDTELGISNNGTIVRRSPSVAGPPSLRSYGFLDSSLVGPSPEVERGGEKETERGYTFIWTQE